jgi:hypothetical protein
MLVGACLTLTHNVSCGHAAEAKFSPQAWRQAVDPQSSRWSREDLLLQFYKQYTLAGMQRKQVIELLGNPAVATELLPASGQRDRRDIYRLSVKNTTSLRIQTDAQDRVTGSPVIDSHPCQARLFIGPAPAADQVLTMAVLRKSLLATYTFKQIVNMTVKHVETLLGKAAKSWEDSPFGGEEEAGLISITIMVVLARYSYHMIVI